MEKRGAVQRVWDTQPLMPIEPTRDMSKPVQSPRTRIGLLLVTGLIATMIVSIGARVFRIDHEPLHVDEIKQVQEVQQPLGEIVELSYRHQQPPLDYLIGKLVVTIFPATDAVQRMPSALAGGLAVALAALLFVRLGMPWAGAFSAVLAAFHPTLIQYSQYARPYALPLFMVLATLACYERWKGTGHKRGWLIAFVTVGSLAMLSRALMPLLALGVFGLVLLVKRIIEQRSLRKLPESGEWPILLALLAMAVLVWLPNFIFGLRRFGSHYLFGDSYDLPARLKTGFEHLVGFGDLALRPLPLAVLAVALLFLATPWFKEVRRISWFVWLPILFTAPMFALAHSLTTPPGQFFATRYMVFLPMGVILTAGAAAEGVVRLIRARWAMAGTTVAVALMVLIIGGLSWPLARSTRDLYMTKTTSDWKAVAEHIDGIERDGDVIISIDVRPLRVGAFRFGFMSHPRYYQGPLEHFRPDDIILSSETAVDQASRYHFVLFVPRLTPGVELGEGWTVAEFTGMLVATTPPLGTSDDRLDAWWQLSNFLRLDTSLLTRIAGYALAARTGHDTGRWLDSVREGAAEYGLADHAENWIERVQLP